MIDKTIIGERPPLSMEYRVKLREIMQRLNEDALKELTPHDVLILCIDRAHKAYFPNQHKDGKRKKFISLSF